MVTLTCPQAHWDLPLSPSSLLLCLPSTLLLCAEAPFPSVQRPTHPSGLSYPSPQGAVPAPPPPPRYVRTHTNLPGLHHAQADSLFPARLRGLRPALGGREGLRVPFRSWPRAGSTFGLKQEMLVN